MQKHWSTVTNPKHILVTCHTSFTKGVWFQFYLHNGAHMHLCTPPPSSKVSIELSVSCGICKEIIHLWEIRTLSISLQWRSIWRQMNKKENISIFNWGLENSLIWCCTVNANISFASVIAFSSRIKQLTFWIYRWGCKPSQPQSSNMRSSKILKSCVHMSRDIFRLLIWGIIPIATSWKFQYSCCDQYNASISHLCENHSHV